MALSLANVISTDTFSTWLTRTNEVIRDAAPSAGNLTTAGGTVTGNLTVTGNAVFNGNTTIISATELTARDAILHLGANNASDTIDMGVVLTYVRGDGSNTHSGFIRDSVTKEIYILDEAGTGQAGQPFNTFNPNAADTVLANVHVKKLTSTNLSTTTVTSNTVTTHGITATGEVTVDRSVTAASFIGDGSQLTNAGSTVASDSTNHTLLVPFTGISSGTMTSANVNSNFTFNPSTGTLSATAFSGDGSNLTNAGSTVASDTKNDRDLLVAFTGVTSGTMTSANVNSTFTFNPASGKLAANSIQFNSSLQKVQTVGTITSDTNLDLSAASIFDVTLGADNLVLTFTNPPSSGYAGSATVILRQDSTGSRNATFTNAIYTDGAPPILTTNANAIDMLSFFTTDNGSNYFGALTMAAVS